LTPVIRQALAQDWPRIWEILEPVFRAGDTYAIAPDITGDEARSYWSAAPRRVFIAEAGGVLLGTYYIVANFAGNADHICNCGYVTAGHARGRGVARAMLAHSLDTARAAGFLAMQYNCVVSTNTRAVALWESCGFDIIGTIPRAFRHPEKGFVDAHVMFKEL
jgi:GNAT superfamily N-acetyltransferase